MEGRYTLKFGIAASTIIIGLLLNYFNIGSGNYLGFASVGTWMIYIGLVMTGVSLLPLFRRKEKLIDERMLAVAAKANRIVFLAVIIAAFVIMIIDGIAPINVSLGMFMAYLVCGMMLTYFAAYKILLIYN